MVRVTDGAVIDRGDLTDCFPLPGAKLVPNVLNQINEDEVRS